MRIRAQNTLTRKMYRSLALRIITIDAHFCLRLYTIVLKVNKIQICSIYSILLLNKIQQQRNKNKLHTTKNH